MMVFPLQKIFLPNIHLNLLLPENIKSAGGQLTEETIARYSQMVGLGKEIAKTFDLHVSLRSTDKRNTGQFKRDRDFSHLVKTLVSLKRTRSVGGREYRGLPDISIQCTLDPIKFKKPVLKHKKKILKKMHIIANN